MAGDNTQVLLARRPEGALSADCFRVVQGQRPTPGEGEALVRTLFVSVSAGSRANMQATTYRSVLEAGEVMESEGVGEVIESRAPDLTPGDVVYGPTGWQAYAAVAAARLRKVERTQPLSHHLSIYGITGLTAYFGLLKCGEPKPGETVVVSAAAGAVGSLVCQISRLQGCRVVGIAGGPEKTAWLEREIGVDAAVDYKAGDLRGRLKTACPGGIDVYFDNVGGEVFEACLFAMKLHGRIACCGAVSSYDGPAPRHGPRGVPGLFVTKRLTMRGFVVYDFDAERDAALAQLRRWVAERKLTVHEDIIDGLDRAPEAFVGLLAGENRGKRIIRVA